MNLIWEKMTSVNKKKKLKNSYCVPGMLKNKEKGPKRLAFFTSSLRKKIKNEKKTNLFRRLFCV